MAGVQYLGAFYVLYRQEVKVIKNVGFGEPGCKAWLLFFFSGCPWESRFTFLSFSFLIHEKRANECSCEYLFFKYDSVRVMI